MTSEDQLVLKEGAEILDIRLNREQVNRFERYLRELNTWRKRLNLVSRENDREIILKDFIDSLTVIRHLPHECSLADCGSGAGFPGIPIKIARPDVRVCLLDSARKKIFFLNNVKRVLKLDGIEVLWTGEREASARAGEFDFVITRAFGSLEKIQDACGSHLKAGGLLLAMKGKKGKAELDAILTLLEERGWELAFTENIMLPFIGHDRMLIGLKKNREDVPRETH